MDNPTIQQRLNDNGFPCGPVDGVLGDRTKAAIVRFQSAHAFSRLVIDGIAGSETQGALANLPNLSPHFQVDELRCHGGGCGCGQVAYVNRELVFALEALRAHTGRLTIEDAYRCPRHNAAIKGAAADSMHVLGGAADPANMPPLDLVLHCQLFSGVGNRGALASHLDVRHVMGAANHTPLATPQNPARWSY